MSSNLLYEQYYLDWIWWKIIVKEKGTKIGKCLSIWTCNRIFYKEMYGYFTFEINAINQSECNKWMQLRMRDTIEIYNNKRQTIYTALKQSSFVYSEKDISKDSHGRPYTVFRNFVHFSAKKGRLLPALVSIENPRKDVHLWGKHAS